MEKENKLEVGFFDEAPGVHSSTRLNSFLLLLFMFGFDFAFMYTKHFEVDYNFIMFNFLLMLGVFAPKYLHKLAETKFNTDDLKGKEISK